MIEAFDISRQVAWEMEGVRRAVARYREAEKSADPLSMPPGRRLLAEVCKPLIAGITAKQEEAKERIASKVRQPLWLWPIQMVDAEKLAVLTLASALGSDVVALKKGVGIPTQAKDLASRIRDEVEHDRWVAEQEHANATAKKLKSEGHTDLLRALKKTYPNLDRKSWARWRTKVEALREQPWEEGVAVSLGTCLFTILIEVAPTRFEMGSRPASGGVQYYLRCTQECRDTMADLTARAEVGRPQLMPMIIPPNPWRYDETAKV